MIVEIHGHYLDRTYFGKLDEIREFVRENIDTRYKILDPELHAHLLQTGYYEMSSTAIAKKDITTEFCRALYKMGVDKVPTEKIRKYGIKVSKMLRD